MNSCRKPVLFCHKIIHYYPDNENQRILLTLSNFLGDCDLTFDAFLHSMGTLCLDRDKHKF